MRNLGLEPRVDDRAETSRDGTLRGPVQESPELSDVERGPYGTVLDRLHEAAQAPGGRLQLAEGQLVMPAILPDARQEGRA